jgi:hypothetical protein
VIAPPRRSEEVVMPGRNVVFENVGMVEVFLALYCCEGEGLCLMVMDTPPVVCDESRIVLLRIPRGERALVSRDDPRMAVIANGKFDWQVSMLFKRGRRLEIMRPRATTVPQGLVADADGIRFQLRVHAIVAV